MTSLSQNEILAEFHGNIDRHRAYLYMWQGKGGDFFWTIKLDETFEPFFRQIHGKLVGGTLCLLVAQAVVGVDIDAGHCFLCVLKGCVSVAIVRLDFPRMTREKA